MTAGNQLDRTTRMLIAVITALALVGAMSARALATDTIYWSNTLEGRIGRAALDGSGGSDLSTAGAPALNEPNGVAIDAAAGRVYWIDEGGHIGFAHLDGTGGGGELQAPGAVISGPRGLAIDPALGRLYWVNQGSAASDAIEYANLDGSGGGDIDTTGATPPTAADGLAIYPATNRIYWADQGGGGKISYANLDGSGDGHDLNTTGATINGASGLAIDAATNTLYVTGFYSENISYVHLDNSGAGPLDVSPLTPEAPYGIALDPAAGRLYFTNWEKPVSIYYASLSGGGGGVLNTAGATATTSQWNFPAILERPAGTASPTISGSAASGATLSCARGNWAPDLLEAFLYRVPQRTGLQWTRDGVDIPGATSATLVAGSGGEYRCRETATNAAGSTAQTSAPVQVPPSNRFTLKRAKLSKSKGTALLFLTLPDPGRVTLSGKHVVARSLATAGGTAKLLVKAKGKAAKTLARKGKLKVKLQIGFTPTGGTRATQGKSLTLVRKPR